MDNEKSLTTIKMINTDGKMKNPVTLIACRTTLKRAGRTAILPLIDLSKSNTVAFTPGCHGEEPDHQTRSIIFSDNRLFMRKTDDLISSLVVRRLEP
jgi:hypothetical protein